MLRPGGLYGFNTVPCRRSGRRGCACVETVPCTWAPASSHGTVFPGLQQELSSRLPQHRPAKGCLLVPKQTTVPSLFLLSPACTTSARNVLEMALLQVRRLLESGPILVASPDGDSARRCRGTGQVTVSHSQGSFSDRANCPDKVDGTQPSFALPSRKAAFP